jgi:3-oxoacyl-[acyl-carrier protein] reductase
VIVNYNSDAKAAAEVVTAIITGGSHATAIQADVTTSSGVNLLFTEAKRIYGRVDIVVANAGISSNGPIKKVTDEEFDRVMAVNLKGVFYALRGAANHIENNGRIIVIGSILNQGLVPGMGAYGNFDQPMSSTIYHASMPSLVLLANE